MATSEHWTGMLRSRFLGARHSRRQHVVRCPPLAERPEVQMSTFCCTEHMRLIKERLRRADRAVEAVGALLQPAEGRVQREPQRTRGRGAWRGRVLAPRASAHRFRVSRLHLWVRGHVCAARSVPRSSDSLSRKL